MIIHYLKIAWRNLLKYKTQSVISIVGLAIGFTAFSFTLSWIRYERGYDKHIPDADRIYRVFTKDSIEVDGVNQYSPNALATYLKENYPEIEAATGVYAYKSDFERNGKTLLTSCFFLRIDTSFFHVFYPEVKVFYPQIIDKEYYLFSKSTAEKLGVGLEHIGQRVDSLKINLLDIVPDKSAHSNVPFDIMYFSNSGHKFDLSWLIYSNYTYIRVKEGVNVSKLEEKLTEISVDKDYSGELFNTRKYQLKLVPLKKLRTIHPDTEVSIKYRQLRLFAAVSLLVIFCAFFNYLMLFINKIKIRNRGLTLHKVNGASGKQLLGMLFCEFILLLVTALLVGLVLTEILYPSFVKFSMIEASKSFILRDAFLFGLSILLLSLIFAFLPVRYFMKRSIQENLSPKTGQGRRTKDRFTRITIILQLIISVLLIFSTSVLVYQFNYLNSDYIGFNRYAINSVYTYPNEIPMDEIKAIPGVVDVIRYGGDFLPKSHIRQSSVERSDTKERYSYYRFQIFGPEFVEFFDINLVEGRNIHAGETGVYLINQTADRLLSTVDSTGMKKIGDVPVVGVIEDMYIDSPLVPVFPSVYGILEKQPWEQDSPITQFYAYKYTKDARYAAEKEIKRFLTEDVGNRTAGIKNMEELYAEYTKSERYLLILLSIMTVGAILISIFGVYSIVTLACNQRRKEIAIRKVNGAKAREIFILFFRQYFLVTVISCIVAFPVGVYIMQRWLEQYTRRVSIEWWLFAGIFVLVLLIVLASIFSRVNRAAKENPAEVVKSE